MIPRSFDPNARVLLSAISMAFVVVAIVAIASCITGCSGSTGTDDAASDVIDPTCHVDEATQSYDADAGAYAICHPDEVVWICSGPAIAQLEANKCRWLGLGANWCCPAI